MADKPDLLFAQTRVFLKHSLNFPVVKRVAEATGQVIHVVEQPALRFREIVGGEPLLAIMTTEGHDFVVMVEVIIDSPQGRIGRQTVFRQAVKDCEHKLTTTEMGGLTSENFDRFAVHVARSSQNW